MEVSSSPSIYHILHVDRLASVLRDGMLYSDETMEQHSGDSGTTIGMTHIKEARKRKRLNNDESRGTVGQYVPFYFCPRSVMLYLIYVRSNELEYKGGQEPIIHLVFDLEKTIDWAVQEGIQWAFTDANARTGYAGFYFTVDDFKKLKWDLIPQQDWRRQEVKDAKQSEFLLKDTAPWHLIKEIGVYDDTIKSKVETIIANEKHKPIVTIYKEWYY